MSARKIAVGDTVRFWHEGRKIGRIIGFRNSGRTAHVLVSDPRPDHVEVPSGWLSLAPPAPKVTA